MTHLSELQLSQFADNGMPRPDMPAAEQHLDNCTTCQSNLLNATKEVAIFRAALEADLAKTAPAITIPAFVYPTSVSRFAMVNIATGLIIWLAQFLWKTVFGEVVMNGAGWLTSIYVPDLYNVASATVLVYLEEGTAMFDNYLALIASCVLLLTGLWLVLLYRKSQLGLTIGLALMISISATAPSPANALELRHDKRVVTVSETETINDTLFVASETVIIKGAINGDLVATGQRITIDGSVSGNVFAFAESITIRGDVAGLVIGAGSSVELIGSKVSGNLAIAGEKLSMDDESSVAGNAMMAGNNATIDGPVGQDLYTFTETTELNSSVGQNMETFSNRVRLLDNANIAGNARLRVKDQEHLHRSTGAIVNGEIEFLDLPDQLADASPYAGIKFYLWQLARLLSAVLAGLVLLWLVPQFRAVRIGTGVEVLTTVGMGLVTLVSLPIIAAVLAITLIGLPFTFLAVVSWLMFIYLAKIVVGLFVGKTLLTNTRYANNDFALLMAGIATVLVAVNLPAIGGIASFLITTFGIGLIAQQLLMAIKSRDDKASMD